MYGESLATATRVRSTAETDYKDDCERCGRPLNRKGSRTAADGLMLCMDCRGVDPDYKKMRRGQGYVETTDAELERIERQLELLQREAS